MKKSSYNQSVILGVTGSIAIYKSCELVRLFKENGTKVHVVMTKSATKLIKPSVFQALSGENVYVNMWRYTDEISMPHIHLSRSSSAIIISPTTSNFMAKLANGIADDLLSSICISRIIPLIIAPAMNVEMWNNPATKRNFKILKEDGVEVLEPNTGNQACGDNGPGRMQEPEEILYFFNNYLSYSKATSSKKNSLKNKTILITAGPTYEAIDPIRGITNRSSGKLGYAIAEISKIFGAKVFLISGPVKLITSSSVNIEYVESSAQMLKKVRKILKEEEVDIFFSVAAVADWTPKNPSKNKLKKNGCNADLHDIEWEKTKDILLEVASIKSEKRPFVVGFAAETIEKKQLAEICQTKLEEKKADMLVGTNAPNTFGKDHAEMLVCLPDKLKININGSKTQIAEKLIHLIIDRIGN